MACGKAKPAGWPAGSEQPDSGGRGPLRGSLYFHFTTDVDEVVGDHAEPDPTLHSGLALVPTAVEAVPPLDHADASLASGPPFLARSLSE